MKIAGNTTYDASFQYHAFVRDVQHTVKGWQKLPPAYPLLASATKGWQDRLGTLQYHTQLKNPQTDRAMKAFEEAWFNRDNRNKALKSLNTALEYLNQGIKALDGQPDNNNRAHYGTMKAAMKFDNPIENRQEWANEQLRSWVFSAQQNLSLLDTVAAKSINRGQDYRTAAFRMKSWMEQNHNVYSLMTQKSIDAVTVIEDCVNQVLEFARANLLDKSAYQSIKSAVRRATMELDKVAVKSYGQSAFSEPIREITNIRGQMDRLVPLIESGDFDESDAYKSLAKMLDQARSLGYMLPTRKLSVKAMECYDNAGAAVVMAIQNQHPQIRAKSLMAAAANLDTLAAAIEQLDGEIVVNE